MAKMLTAATYEQEKLTGVRRPDGAKALERIKPKHKQIMALHLQGYRNDEIAKITGYTPPWISTVLRDPLVKDFLEKAYEDQSSRLKALFSDVVDSLRDALDPSKSRTQDRLRAAEVWLKIHSDQEKKDKDASPDSAESIVARIIREAKGPTNVQINQYGNNER